MCHKLLSFSLQVPSISLESYVALLTFSQLIYDTTRLLVYRFQFGKAHLLTRGCTTPPQHIPFFITIPAENGNFKLSALFFRFHSVYFLFFLHLASSVYLPSFLYPFRYFLVFLFLAVFRRDLSVIRALCLPYFLFIFAGISYQSIRVNLS